MRRTRLFVVSPLEDARDYLGRCFGHLRVVAVLRADKQALRRARVQARCDCGRLTSIDLTSLTDAAAKHCGCVKAQKSRARMTTHGLSRSPEYNVWYSPENCRWATRLEQRHNRRAPAAFSRTAAP